MSEENFDIQRNIWEEFITPYAPNLAQLFGSKTWKKAIFPYLKAQREVKIRTILQNRGKDEERGMVIALEMLMNLPQALDAWVNREKVEKATPSNTTDYGDSLLYDDENVID